MRRGLIISLASVGGLCVLLAVAVGTIGSQLDQTRLDREDMSQEIERLRGEAERLSAERDSAKSAQDSVRSEQASLKSKVDQQDMTIEEMRLELERMIRTSEGSAGTTSVSTR